MTVLKQVQLQIFLLTWAVGARLGRSLSPTKVLSEYWLEVLSGRSMSRYSDLLISHPATPFLSEQKASL